MPRINLQNLVISPFKRKRSKFIFQPPRPFDLLLVLSWNDLRGWIIPPARVSYRGDNGPFNPLRLTFLRDVPSLEAAYYSGEYAPDSRL